MQRRRAGTQNGAVERGSALGREIANFMANDSEINVQETA